MHACYLPSESATRGGHGVSPARVQQRPRESLPSERAVSNASGDRQAPPASGVSRHVPTVIEKYVSSLSLLHAHRQSASIIHSQVKRCASSLHVYLVFDSIYPVISLASGRSVCPAPFFSRSRLPPLAEFIFLRSHSEGQASPNFLPPGPHFPNRHAQFSLRSVRCSRPTPVVLALTSNYRSYSHRGSDGITANHRSPCFHYDHSTKT
jgi:hypothetical protein